MNNDEKLWELIFKSVTTGLNKGERNELEELEKKNPSKLKRGRSPIKARLLTGEHDDRAV